MKRPDSEAEPLGVTPRGSGVNVVVFSAHADAIEFCLFDGEREIRRVPLRGRTGDVFHDWIDDVPSGARYGLRAHGPYLPRQGHCFNPAKLLIDPYARAIDRPFALHPSMFGYRDADADGPLSIDDRDSAPFMPKAIVLGPEAPFPGPRKPITPWSRTVLYELQARGFTARHPDIPASLRGRFAGLGHPASIEHLLRLGITSVEIMPVAAWIEERHLASRGLRNYWGYNPVAMMAPDPYLAPGGWAEIRQATAVLAEAGIEVILDVVLNHSGEGDALGPTLSLRGLDNATYYRARPGTPWRYADDAGCGNVLALDRPAPVRLAMDALRVWADRAGIHGFRFDLATAMGRRDDGFDPKAALLSAIAQDPVLRNLKLIAEPWDVGPDGYRIGAFPATWGEWNDRFRDGVRRFWRGDPGQLGEFATRLAGSSDLFSGRHVTSRSINYLVAHDGFTLADLVSYEHKSNFANGEANQDGTDTNWSWNNGVDGPSDDPTVAAARRRDQRALLATLILARGTPMLAMGAELGHSQGGNNNVYAQDNPTAWLDWERADAGLLAWTRRMLQIRRDHAVLRDDRFLTGEPVDISLFPDVEWRGANGQRLTPETWNAPDASTLVMTLAGEGEVENTTERISVVFHRGLTETEVTLPSSRAGHIWRIIADSAAEDDQAMEVPVADNVVGISTRSVMVLAELPRDRRKPVPADSDVLDRLSRAAGIAPEWWDVAGRRTLVGDDTKGALLASMRLSAATDSEARDSLRHLSEDHDRRALPRTAVTRDGVSASIGLSVEPGTAARPTWLTIEREDGEIQRIRLGAEDIAVEPFTGLDGLPARAWRIALPVLALGRHRLWREDAPDAICQLTVAPRACFLPEPIAGGKKRFGISAQLYALRRRNDQGVGDFTTLAEFAEASGLEKAATIGINPLHMLFPGQRERASPYHPSDRRFIDPIYLDVASDLSGPEPEGTRELIDDLHRLDAGERVAWSDVWALKLSVLERRFAVFMADSPDDPAFREYIQRGGLDLWRFATFHAIAEARPGENWRQWPDGLRLPGSTEVAAFAHANARRVRFHQYLQFLADRQFGFAAARAARVGLTIGLYRDLAVGAAPDGAEAWSRSDELADGAWVGAPPDPFAAEGQNWHLPPNLPHVLRQTGFASFRALIKANMRHAGALRIDHAMGLMRLFWIPDGGAGADGAYVAYPFDELLAQLALESVRARCMVVGEDLGTVPEGFRQVMAEADILSYRVMLLEREGREFRPASAYPRRAVACVTTHDLPPLAGWWEGADIEERARLGQIPDAADATRVRNDERVALVGRLIGDGSLAGPPSGEPPVDTIIAGAYAFAAATPCDLVLAQAEDLVAMRTGVNLPGTDQERPNWRLRLPEPVETLLTTSMAQTILGSMRALGRGTEESDADGGSDG